MKQVMEQLEKAKLPTSIMIDCSHDNSRKNHLNQPTVAQSIVRLTSTHHSRMTSVTDASVVQWRCRPTRSRRAMIRSRE